MSLAAFYLFSISCTEQHNPFPYRNQLKQERVVAHTAHPQLAEDGSLPTAIAAVELSEIDQKFNDICSSCHGLDGRAQTDAAKALNPVPRDFTDAAWQDSVTDTHIRDVIEKGGPAVLKRESGMGPWGAVLTGTLLDQMVGKVRSFKAAAP